MGSQPYKETDRYTQDILAQGLRQYKQLGHKGLQSLASQYSVDALALYNSLGSDAVRAQALERGMTVRQYDKLERKGVQRVANEILGDMCSAEMIWRCMVSCFWSYASRNFFGYVPDREDLLSLSYMTVRKALECYDPVKGSFTSYALRSWDQAIRHHIRTYQLVKIAPDAGSWKRFLAAHKGNMSLDIGGAIDRVSSVVELQELLESDGGEMNADREQQGWDAA